MSDNQTIQRNSKISSNSKLNLEANMFYPKIRKDEGMIKKEEITIKKEQTKTSSTKSSLPCLSNQSDCEDYKGISYLKGSLATLMSPSHSDETRSSEEVIKKVSRQ